MPFLTVDALIGNQAFQNGRCHICFSLSLDKNKTGYNLLMALKCTHQMLNPLTPGAFCQKCVIFGHFGGFEALIWPKMHLQHDSLPFLPLASRFTTFWLGRPRTRRWPKSLGFSISLSVFSFCFLFAAVIDLLLGLLAVKKLLRKRHRGGQFLPWSSQV